MTREQKINSGKLWQVHPDGLPDDVLFEGNKTACMGYIKQHLWRQYRKGLVRLGKLIWEKQNCNNNLVDTEDVLNKNKGTQRSPFGIGS